MQLRVPTAVTALKWVFCLLTALLVALVAFGMSVAISAAYHVRSELVGLMAQDATLVGAFALFASFNTIMAFLACLCVVYGAPRASGSGLPELVTMLNGVDGSSSSHTVPHFLTFRTFCMKVIGAVAAVAASLPLGYQGVMLHIGGMLASMLASLLPHFELSNGAKRSPMDPENRELLRCMTRIESTSDFNEYAAAEPLLPSSKRQKRLPGIFDVVVDGIRRQRRGHLASTGVVDRVHFIAATHVTDQVACGAAAGVSAAFKAPIGGMLYLMELSTRWRVELTWRTFFSTSVTALALSEVGRACGRASICASVQSFLSVSGGPFQYSFTAPYSELPIIVLFAALMGAVGAAFVAVNAATVKLRNLWSHSRALLLLEVVLFTMLYSAALVILAAAGHCHACDELAVTGCAPGAAKNELHTLGCAQEGEYNDLASLVLSPNVSCVMHSGLDIRSLWSMRAGDFHPTSLALFIPIYFAAAAWTSGLAIPSGSFSPTMLLGSCCGRLFAQCLALAGLVNEPDVRLYSLLGAAGLFTGQTRMTVSLCVIMLEMVNSQEMLPFLMVTIIVAKGVADRLSDSIILRRIKLKKLPFIQRMPHRSMKRARLAVTDIVRLEDHPILPEKATAQLVQSQLKQNPCAQIFVVVRSRDAHSQRHDSNALLSSTEDEEPLFPPTASCSLHPGYLTDTFSQAGRKPKWALVGIVTRSALHMRLQEWEEMALDSGDSQSSSEAECLSRSITPRVTVQAKTPRAQSWAAMATAAPEQGIFNDSILDNELTYGYAGLLAYEHTPSRGLGMSFLPEGLTCATQQHSSTEAASLSDTYLGSRMASEHCMGSTASYLLATFDLSAAAQVPPIMMSPDVGLEAIFAVMNNMAVELVAIVSPDGGYYGLLTRSCMMRFQRRAAK